MLLDSNTVWIYKSCQYGLTPLNSIEDKSDRTFDEKIVEYGYGLCCKELFSVKNGEVSKYLETFSNFSIKTPELLLFKEKVHKKM